MKLTLDPKHQKMCRDYLQYSEINLASTKFTQLKTKFREKTNSPEIQNPFNIVRWRLGLFLKKFQLQIFLTQEVWDSA